MEFKDIVKQRHATKHFNGEKIPEDKIKELIEIIRYSPSSFNLQPWKIKIISDNKTKEEIKEAAYGQPQINTCSHLLVFCAYSDLDKLLEKLEKLMIEKDANTPEKIKSFIQIVEDWKNAMAKEEYMEFARREIYLAVSNALNGAKSLGFDSCPMGGFDPPRVAQILNLDENLKAEVLVPVGYADDTPRKKLRFEDITL